MYLLSWNKSNYLLLYRRIEEELEIFILSNCADWRKIVRLETCVSYLIIKLSNSTTKGNIRWNFARSIQTNVMNVNMVYQIYLTFSGDFCSFAHHEFDIKAELIHNLEFDQDFYLFYYKTIWCPFNYINHDRAICVYAHNWQDFRRKPS